MIEGLGQKLELTMVADSLLVLLGEEPGDLASLNQRVSGH